MPDASPIPTPLDERLAELRRGPLSFVCFLGAVLFATALLGRRTETVEYRGLARVVPVEVSAVAPARVEALFVELFEHVEAGEAIARLDGSALDAELAIARAEIGRLQAELDAARERSAVLSSELEDERLSDLRRYANDEAEHRLQALEIAVEMAFDRAELERLTLLYEYAADLAEKGIGPRERADDLLLQRASFAARVAENERLEREVQTELAAAIARRHAFERDAAAGIDSDRSLAPFAAAIRVQESRVAALGARVETLVLRAPVAGRVSALPASAGQAILAGEPVAVVTPPIADEVVVWVPEAAARELAQGAAFAVAGLMDRAHWTAAHLERVGPASEPLPDRLWMLPAQPEYGVPVLIGLRDAAPFIPGEPVVVRLAPGEAEATDAIAAK